MKLGFFSRRALANTATQLISERQMNVTGRLLRAISMYFFFGGNKRKLLFSMLSLCRSFLLVPWELEILIARERVHCIFFRREQRLYCYLFSLETTSDFLSAFFNIVTKQYRKSVTYHFFVYYIDVKFSFINTLLTRTVRKEWTKK